MRWEGPPLFDIHGVLPISVDVSLDSYPGPAWEVRPLRYRSGWLMVSRATLETAFSLQSAPLVACVDESGETIAPYLASKLFEMRATPSNEICEIPPDDLEQASDALYWDFLGKCDLEHLAMLEKAEERERNDIARLEARAQKALDQADAYIAELRGWMRRADPSDAKRQAVLSQIKSVEEKQVEASNWLAKKIGSIREAKRGFETEIMEALGLHGEVEHCYTIHWTAQRVWDSRGTQASSASSYNWLSEIAPTQVHVERSAVRLLRATKSRHALPYRTPERVELCDTKIELVPSTVPGFHSAGRLPPSTSMQLARAENRRVAEQRAAERRMSRLAMEAVHRKHARRKIASTPSGDTVDEFEAEKDRKRAVALRKRAQNQARAQRRKDLATRNIPNDET